MTSTLHPLAAEHLPPFITAPGETDVLMIAMMIFLIVAVVGVGILYFRLHALPEQIAHKGQKLQFQIVAVLALLALFTHNHLFWIAGLILALVPLPDFSTPLSTMATSLSRIADAAEQTSAESASDVEPLAPRTRATAPDRGPIVEQKVKAADHA